MFRPFARHPHNTAHGLASLGRHGDSMLVHMSPAEVGGLQKLAMAAGGSLTINPHTGLPEAGFLSSLLPTLAGGILNSLFPKLGAFGAAGIIGAEEALRHKNIGAGLMAGLGAYGGASISEAGRAEGLFGNTPTDASPPPNVDWQTSRDNALLGKVTTANEALLNKEANDPLGLYSGNLKAPTLGAEYVPTQTPLAAAPIGTSTPPPATPINRSFGDKLKATYDRLGSTSGLNKWTDKYGNIGTLGMAMAPMMFDQPKITPPKSQTKYYRAAPGYNSLWNPGTQNPDIAKYGYLPAGETPFIGQGWNPGQYYDTYPGMKEGGSVAHYADGGDTENKAKYQMPQSQGVVSPSVLQGQVSDFINYLNNMAHVHPQGTAGTGITTGTKTGTTTGAGGGSGQGTGDGDMGPGSGGGGSSDGRGGGTGTTMFPGTYVFEGSDGGKGGPLGGGTGTGTKTGADTISGGYVGSDSSGDYTGGNWTGSGTISGGYVGSDSSGDHTGGNWTGSNTGNDGINSSADSQGFGDEGYGSDLVNYSNGDANANPSADSQGFGDEGYGSDLVNYSQGFDDQNGWIYGGNDGLSGSRGGVPTESGYEGQYGNQTYSPSTWDTVKAIGSGAWGGLKSLAKDISTIGNPALSAAIATGKTALRGEDITLSKIANEMVSNPWSEASKAYDESLAQHTPMGTGWSNESINNMFAGAPKQDDGFCTDPNTLVTLADGSEIKVVDLKVGTMVRGYDENLREFGSYPVTAYKLAVQPKVVVSFVNGKRDYVCSESHRVLAGGEFKTITTLSPGMELGGDVIKAITPIGDGDVVKITVDVVHTYLTEGIVSHNVKMAMNNSFAGVNPESEDYGDYGDFRQGGQISHYAYGGTASLGDTYAAGGKLLRGPGDGMSDSIPAVITGQKPQRAALADGEFVIPADVVSHLGNGSTEAGSKKLYAMMDKIRMARTGRKAQGKQINPDRFLPK